MPPLIVAALILAALACILITLVGGTAGLPLGGLLAGAAAALGIPNRPHD